MQISKDILVLQGNNAFFVCVLIVLLEVIS